MKFRLPFRLTLYVCAIALSFVCEGYERTTAEVAAAEHYPTFLLDYRNKAERLLSSFIIETRLRVQKLSAQDLFHRADALQTFYVSEFEKMQDTIDTFFVNFDKEFLITAQKLDDEGASEKIKAAFIMTMKKKIENALTTLLKFYTKKFNLLEQSQENIMKPGQRSAQQPPIGPLAPVTL